MRGLRIVSVALCLWAAFAVPPALADPETDAYHAAVAGAYRHYREAVHYFENDNPELGTLSLDEFLAAWRPVIRKYGDAPPPAYRKSARAKFKQSLLQVLSLAQKAQDNLDHPSKRIGRLEVIRMVLGLLRRENNVRVYSDCIDPMNSAMRRLWAYRRAPPTTAKPETIAAFKTVLSDTTRWYRQCRGEAPADIRDTEEFRRLFAGALASLAKLEAVDIAHSDALVSILRELHSFDRLIWLRFG